MTEGEIERRDQGKTFKVSENGVLPSCPMLAPQSGARLQTKSLIGHWSLWPFS